MSKLAEKRPALLAGRGAVIVHGHRLSSLYRFLIKCDKSFIVLKILILTQSFHACGASIFGTLKGGAGFNA